MTDILLDDAELSDLDVPFDLTSVPLAERAALTAGSDFWHTAAAPTLGLGSLHVTDGPNGARGATWGSTTSSCLPCGTALAASWDTDLVERIGRVLGAEARGKGAGVLLAPTVNIHRYPLAGRNFECFSEDPLLSAQTAVAYIRGVQSEGVGCAVKHFVCNDQERDRMTVDVEVDERTLREIYLPPFEAAVREADVYAVMSAYNKLAGLHCSENPDLLERILRDEWGFEGVVVSDWFGTHSTEAIAMGLDLEMPGPAAFLGEHLLAAVIEGRITQDRVDTAAGRVARLIARTTGGQLGTRAIESAAVAAREAAIAGAVLLRNDGVLPLPATPLRVALLGPYADRLTPQGGGAAEVTPPYVVSPLEALRVRPGVEVRCEQGCALPGQVRQIDPRLLSVGDRTGVLSVEYFAGPALLGEVVSTELFHQTRLIWTGPPAGVADGLYSARARATFTPDTSGIWRFGVVSAGTSRLLLDGRVVCDNTDPQPGDTFFGMGSTEITADLMLEAGRSYQLLAEFASTDGPMPLGGLQLGAELVPAADACARAAAAAAAADIAIIVVGSDSRWETEGTDRASMLLPGEQDALIAAVAAANPRTIVVLNCGSPVEMPWATDVAAVLQLWYPGQEGGTALADILFGDAEPGGRLPVTLPRMLEDSPTHASYVAEVSDGSARYLEGLHVGYRHYDAHEVEPRFCFGHGLSYTTFAYGELEIEERDEAVHVRLQLSNTGSRAGSEVVQLYVQPPRGTVTRPVQELKAFQKVRLAPGESTTVELTLPDRAFAHWDIAAHDWQVEPGTYQLLVGASSRDIRRAGHTTRS